MLGTLHHLGPEREPYHAGCLHSEKEQLRAQVTQLQQHNTEMVERCRALTAEKEILLGRIGRADEARDLAIKEMSAYARRCGELEAQLCAQMWEPTGRKAMHLVLAELRHAKAKYPHFASTLDQANTVLTAEHGEVAAAILAGDIEGEHGVLREAAQVAAVALRIIEMAYRMLQAKAELKAFAEAQPTAVCTCGTCMACQDAGLGR